MIEIPSTLIDIVAHLLSTRPRKDTAPMITAERTLSHSTARLIHQCVRAVVVMLSVMGRRHLYHFGCRLKVESYS